MAASLTPLSSAAALLLCMLPVAAGAQVLPDPTRPPVEIGDGAAFAVQRSAADVKGLLSVIISPTRCAAIIDGKTVRLGEQHGGAKLVEITAGGVVLQGPNGRHAMALFPGVGVKMTEPEPSPRQAVSCTLENQKTTQKSTRKAELKEKK